jgi:hypothetical protein
MFAAIAACCGPAAAPASVVSVTETTSTWQVEGWTLICRATAWPFDRCEAGKALGGARVTIEIERYDIRARVDTQCKRGKRIEGVEEEWPLAGFPFHVAIPRIQDRVDRARAACGQRPLSAADRDRLWEMVVLLYGLRPREGEL